MHRRVRRAVGWVGLASVGIAGAVHASAPVDQYDWFSPADDAIWDEKTGLLWARSHASQRTYDQAKLYCGDLEIERGTEIEKDFRLPTVKELLTLVDEQPRAVYVNGTLRYPRIDPNAFPDTPMANFWSVTPDPNNSGWVWLVGFDTGRMTAQGLENSAYVRCVKNK